MDRFRKVTPQAVEYIANNMRKADQAEVRASNNFSPFEAIHAGLKISPHKGVFWHNNEPVIIYGLSYRDPLNGVGIPWALGTDTVKKCRKSIIHWSPIILNETLKICPNLVNYVHADNKQNVRWLKWLGFTVDEPQAIGVNGELFHRFHMGNV